MSDYHLEEEKDKWKNRTISGKYKIYYLCHSDGLKSFAVTRNSISIENGVFSHAGTDYSNTTTVKIYNNEVNPLMNIISEESPFGRTLIQHDINDEFMFNGKTYTVIDIDDHWT